MDSSKIPVTYDFFKKYTYHEEWVDVMFKAKAKGNQQIYDALCNSPESKDKALKLYFEAFYLKPQIREKYHIRIKPVPKKIKDKLLQIPEQNSVTTTNENSISSIPQNRDKPELLNEYKESNAKTSIGGEITSIGSIASNLDIQRKLLLANSVSPSDKEVEDDSEPLSSPENSGTIKEKYTNSVEVEKETENQKTSMENNNLNNNSSKDLQEQTCEKGSPKISTDEREQRKDKAIVEDNSHLKHNFNTLEEPPSISKEVQSVHHNKSKGANDITNELSASKDENVMEKDVRELVGQQPNIKESQTHKNSSVNYKDLKPYIHCCPLTYNEFRKYSNITQLVQEFCKNKCLDTHKQRENLLQRSYILFYLAPEHRKTKPINKIQVIDDCPSHIREKFFNIPTNLYIKEQVDKEKEEDCKTTKEESIISNAETTETIPLAQEQNTSFNKTNNESLPVTFEEFKKYTHYEIVIDNLFKSVAHNNENIYWRYKNSQEAFNGTLMNYYRAFYLIPIIREKFPIHFKLTPKSLKCRLLQIPEGVDVTAFPNIQADQLVFPELNTFVEIKQENKNADGVENVAETNLGAVRESETQLHAIENTRKYTQSKSSLQENNRTSSCCLDSSSAVTTKLPIKENAVDRTETSLQNNKITSSPVTGIKRNHKNVIEEPSPKRLRTQQEDQTDHYFENNETTKKHYKDLLPYAHCCPVTFSQFKKYTNISELFTRYCLSRYKDLKRLPSIIKRAYILYYLAPENRKFKPFNKLKLTDDCPLHLKEKMFEMPTNLYKNEENLQENIKNSNIVIKKEINTESQQLTASEGNQKQQAIANHSKATIEILENRLLPPTILNLSNHFPNSEGTLSIHCLNSNCVFHFISHHDFMQQTNILQILPQPQDINTIKSMFKKFVHNIIKESNCDDIYIHGNLLSKILKHHNICENCESEIIDLINKDTAELSKESEQERNHNKQSDNLLKNISGDTERLQNIVVGSEQEINESLAVTNKENLTENTSHSRPKKLPGDLVKYLKQEKTYQKFRQKLLTKLNLNFDSTVDFSSDTYNIFLQCNEIPLEQILNDFCSMHEDITKRILNDKELCHELQRYYYFKYLTNPNIGIKYPVNIKYSEENSNLEHECTTEISNKNNKTKEAEKIDTVNVLEDKNTNVAEKSNSNTSTSTKDHDAVTISQKNLLNDTKALEKAKRIFFRNAERTNTLSYVVRTSLGLKQLILRKILTMSYEEFLKLTSIYEGQSLYNDGHISECMYRFVFCKPNIWPTNLYIKLKDLCNFLFEKHVRFENYSNMLKYISPKLLHWSDLRLCTTIERCVEIDYEKRTGKKLNLNDETLIANECNEYYNRCWKSDKWLESTPLINTEFYKNYLSNRQQAEVTIPNVSALQQIIELPIQSTANVGTTQNEPSATQQKQSEQTEIAVQTMNSETVPEYVSEVDIETTTAENTSTNVNLPINEFNCILLPNTQQQISMLPDEVEVTSDPLNNCFRNSNLNESLSSNESSISVGEICTTIKTESNNKKLLSNLLFYEDDDSNMQCIPCEEEIVNLDESISQVCENLPPSQIHFDEGPSQEILSDQLIGSDNSNFVLNLAQRLPSSIESNDTLCNQQQQNGTESVTTLTQMVQLPEAILESSGENENQLHQKQNIVHNNEGILNLEQLLCHEEVNIESSPNTIEELSNIFNQLQSPSESATSVTVTMNSNVCTIASSLENVASCSTGHSLNVVQQNNNSDDILTALPIRKCFKAAAKNKKNVAKVKPLKNSDLVPQIQHPTRPLATKPAFPAGSSTISSTPALILQNYAAIVPSTQTTTSIRISQELNTNCSVFDNSSLLRIADHNYHEQSLSNSVCTEQHKNQTPQNVILTANSSTLNASRLPSPCSINIPSTSMCLESNNQTSKLPTIAEVDTQPPPRRISLRNRNSVYKDNNDKVNNDPLTCTNNNRNNLVATVSPNRHDTFKFITKQNSYRQLLKFHYFKNLTAQHIRDYLLPSVEINKTYIEANILTENFRTRLINKSISPIFRFWPKKIRQDFLSVLSDLNEFHYDVFQRNTLKNHEDLRVRILFWLLNTAPSFSLCQLIFEENNTEFANCESVHNGNNISYQRKPFISLEKALNTKVLEKIKDLKRKC